MHLDFGAVLLWKPGSRNRWVHPHLCFSWPSWTPGQFDISFGGPLTMTSLEGAVLKLKQCLWLGVDCAMCRLVGMFSLPLSCEGGPRAPVSECAQGFPLSEWQTVRASPLPHGGCFPCGCPPCSQSSHTLSEEETPVSLWRQSSASPRGLLNC